MMDSDRFLLKTLLNRLMLASLLMAFGPCATADVKLPRLLSDGLILQRDRPANLWGWADDGETVRVFLDGELAGTAEAVQGRWQLQLPAHPAGGPHRLKFEGDNVLVVEDAWFGDIWVASGQSNMELPMERVQDRYAAEIAAADLPLVRQFKVPKAYDFERPHEDVDSAGWVPSTPETVGEFSAVAWFFARSLQDRYGVPIGIINSSYGGSPAEGWLSEQELEAWPEYLAIAKSYREEGYLAGLRAADQADADEWYGNLDRADRGLNADPPWSASDIDDADWPLMEVPGNWANTDLGLVHGAVWFRKTIDLPTSVKGQPALLNLGRIVDADTTWINGVKVGATTYQYPPRRYEIPAGVLRAGSNTIVVRVVNVGGEGGFVTDKPYWLKSGSQSFDLNGPWRFRLGAASEAIPPMRFMEWRQPLGYYNAMLAPLQNMTIKGVIWYQGETNVGRAAEYADLFPAMIRAWRRQWGQGDFPFLFVQLANFLEASDDPVDSEWAELRDAQQAALSEPATAMAVTIDVGEWNDIHPLNKQAVGERLALAARRVAYGEQDLVYSGPMLDSVKAGDGALVLSFSHAGGGLEARGGPLREFAVAGPDGRYVPAEAHIQDGAIVVLSDAVPDPMWVRYAWADNPAQANLYNREGLPASPFQAHLSDPLHVGRMLIDDLLSREDYMMYEADDFNGIHYAEVAIAFAAVRFAAATHDLPLLGRVLTRYADTPGTETLVAAEHVDASMYGALPLQKYLDTRQPEYLEEGLLFADRQWASTLDNGLSSQSRYWIDDVWMMGILQVQAYRATGKAIYLDRAALMTEKYLEKLQTASGLFHHGYDSPFFWGRGNGWVAAGMAELLSELPPDHPRYPFIVDRYRQMMNALLRYQEDDGMWRQLVDDDGAWPETSATAMFGYAMAVGVRQGILPAEPYRPAYLRAWTALTDYIDGSGQLTEVCAGTGKGSDRQYYLDRPRITGDFHGQAPLLWFATELLEAPSL